MSLLSGEFNWSRQHFILYRKNRGRIMTYRTRIKYTAEQKAEMWDRWQRGESLNSIGPAFDRPSSSIFSQLAPSGGIRPPIRQRSGLALTLSQREEISRGIASNLSLPSIEAQLGRSLSTISREIKRNGGYDSYRAASANQAAWDRARRPKRCKLATNPALSRIVAAKLQLNWSPQQIAAWLKRNIQPKKAIRYHTRPSIEVYLSKLAVC
jgi:hypothetical protein